MNQCKTNFDKSKPIFFPIPISIPIPIPIPINWNWFRPADNYGYLLSVCPRGQCMEINIGPKIVQKIRKKIEPIDRKPTSDWICFRTDFPAFSEK